MGSCVAQPCPSPFWVSASESANGSKRPGLEAPLQGRPWNLSVLSPPLLWALRPHWLPLLAGLWHWQFPRGSLGPWLAGLQDPLILKSVAISLWGVRGMVCG